MDGPTDKSPSPWRWIPTLYFAQGLPFVAAMMLSVVMLSVVMYSAPIASRT